MWNGIGSAVVFKLYEPSLMEGFFFVKPCKLDGLSRCYLGFKVRS